MTTASLLPPVKRNYGGGGNVDGYLHRARIQSDTMDHFDPNVSLFCSRGRRNEKHHLAILTGWRASPERWLQPGPRPAFRFIQAPAFTKAFFKVNHTTDAGGFFSFFFFFLRESKQGRGRKGGRANRGYAEMNGIITKNDQGGVIFLEGLSWIFFFFCAVVEGLKEGTRENIRNEIEIKFWKISLEDWF